MTGGVEDQLRPRLDQRAGEQREFDVVADADADAAECGVEQAQLPAARDAPGLAFEPGHHDLVLKRGASVRAVEPGAVVKASGRHLGRQAAAENVDAVTARQLLMQLDHARLQPGDGRQLAVQVARHRLGEQRGQLHGAILREHQEAGTLVRGGRHPSADLGGVVLPVVEPVDRILRRGDLEPARAHASAFIQNCIGLAVSASWSISRQTSCPTMPSTGANPRPRQKPSSGT